MSSTLVPTEAGRQYAAAHTAHYQSKDLHEALKLYQGIVETHPDAQEAAFSRSQIVNIVRAVIPEQMLLESELHLALATLEREDRGSPPTAREPSN